MTSGGQRCDTIGCDALATHALAYHAVASSPWTAEVSPWPYVDFVCEPCAAAYVRRRALRATARPLPTSREEAGQACP